MAAKIKIEMPQTRPPMDDITSGFQTKSDKIRALAKVGYSRAEIARHLSIRYQHVRNVLIDDERAARTAPWIQPAATTAGTGVSPAPDSASLHPARACVEADGRVQLPKDFYKALGLREGDPIIATLEGDVIRLMSLPASVRRAQAIVRRFIPPGVSLVDELIAERRAEAKREDSDE